MMNTIQEELFVEGREYLRNDCKMKFADLHVHTSCSRKDVLPVESLEPESLYRKGLDLGLDYIVFTDHDTMDAYDIIGWEREKLVTGVEFSLKDLYRVGHTIHINVYTLSREQFEDLTALRNQADIMTFTEYCRTCGLPFMYNHPFWFESGETPNISIIPDVCTLFPVVEYNMHRIQSKNQFALALAEKYNKGIVATTDTHIGEIGKALTAAHGETFTEFFNKIASRKCHLLKQDWTMDNFLEEVDSWIDRLYEMASDDSMETKLADNPMIYKVRKLFTQPTLNWFPRLIQQTKRKSLRPFIEFYFWLQGRESRQINNRLELFSLN